MNTKWSTGTTLGVFFLITALGFFIWILVLVLFWFILESLNITTDLMIMIEALSTALAAAAVFGAGIFAYRELSEVADSRYMDIADRLFGELNSQENIEARRRIFQNLHEDPEEGIKRMTPEDRDAVKRVLNSLDRVAFLTQSGWVPDELIMPWMHPMISKSWEKLEPYVVYERNRRNEPYFYQHAGELADKCRRWREKNLTDAHTKWIDNAL